MFLEASESWSKVSVVGSQKDTLKRSLEKHRQANLMGDKSMKEFNGKKAFDMMRLLGICEYLVVLR